MGPRFIESFVVGRGGCKAKQGRSKRVNVVGQVGQAPGRSFSASTDVAVWLCFYLFCPANSLEYGDLDAYSGAR